MRLYVYYYHTAIRNHFRFPQLHYCETSFILVVIAFALYATLLTAYELQLSPFVFVIVYDIANGFPFIVITSSREKIRPYIYRADFVQYGYVHLLVI